VNNSGSNNSGAQHEPNNRNYCDLNALRTIAIFGVVLMHVFDVFCSSRYLRTVCLALCGIPCLTVLLLLSGMGMHAMRMPVNFRGYLRYMRIYALPHWLVYTVFFVFQTCVILLNYHLGVDVDGLRGMGQSFDVEAIAKGYILADSYGSMTIWYMHMLAVTVAIWPLVHRVRFVPNYVVFCGLVTSGWLISCFGPTFSQDMLPRQLLCVAGMYLGWKASWMRHGDHRRRCFVFGFLYVAATVPLLILLQDQYHYPLYSLHDLDANTSLILCIMLHGASVTSRFCGAFFLASVVGLLASRLVGLKAWFVRGAHASRFTFLVHRLILLGGVSVFIVPVRDMGKSWGTFPLFVISLLLAMLLMLVGHYTANLARVYWWLNCIAIGRWRRPQIRPLT